MKAFQKINNITGWVIFLIAATVYTITVEETASFWDCGEFIAVSYKLQVPHPPGAPLFLLLGRMFSFLALGDVERVAYWINMLSVVASALTILFLFWTIVLLCRKFIKAENGNYTTAQIATMMAAGAIGALAYTFSDSFWFSAVEAEVYGMSSFLTAFVFWAMLKWELIEDQQYADRWLVMIAYTMGLSIGVHLLNLVTIPALAVIAYYKIYGKPTLFGWVTAVFTGLVIVGVINSGIIPGLPTLAGWFEIFFVNSFGMPFNSGIIIFGILLVAALYMGIRYSEQNKKEVLNLVTLCVTFILIGYSCYGIVLVRSNYNPPIDENNPEDVISFVRYLKREQYGDRPLLFGPTYEAKRIDIKRTTPIYRKAENKYEIFDYKTEAVYDPKAKMLLPRVYSQQEGHINLYKSWIGMKDGEKLTMFHNLKYMFVYQFGHMYFRYFMWNFAGRESDDKEAGFMLPWDDVGVELPHELATNKARVNFYMLPLLLGFIGLFFHYRKDQPNFWNLLLLFFLTGLALVIYLNSPPVEPRERDYIYVGSFYVFAIWIGLGVVAIQEAMANFLKGNSPYAAGALCLVVPVLMGAQGWNNHDRSGRFHSVDQAKNTLRSCAPNAILFTGGDNDTFPLWYVQEVEGFRTDVRVVVLSYFSTDWYIAQMKRPAYESEPLPLSMGQNSYLQGKNDWAPLVEDEALKNNAVNLRTFIRLVDQGDNRVQVQLSDGSFTAKLPSRFFSLDVNKADVLSKNFIPAGKEDRIVDKMVFQLKEGSSAIFKSDLAILDLLATNEWERPIYFNNTSANTTALDLRPFMQLEGMAYRLMPIRAKSEGEVGEVNVDVMLENMRTFEFRGFENPDVYHDEEYRKFGSNTLNSYFRLSKALYDEGRKEEAQAVLDEGLTNIPDRSIPYSFFTGYIAEMYYMLGEKERASGLTDTLKTRSLDMMAYLENHSKGGPFYSDLRRNSYIYLNQLAFIYRRLSERTRIEVARLENQMVLSVEKVPTDELERLKELQKYYTERYIQFAELMEAY
jgi:tetratricopeptide (TPR) repeat protein